MSEMPRAESFQRATEITDENSNTQAHTGSRGKLRRIALALALLAGTAAGAYYGHNY